MEMGMEMSGKQNVLRIESFRIENYRVLRSFELNDLTPMTVLIGANGSGKSTVLDALSFLSESFRFGLRHTWIRRGCGIDIKTVDSDSPISFELKCRQQSDDSFTYHLSIDDGAEGPEVVEEWLGIDGQPHRLMEFNRGSGRVGDKNFTLCSPDLIAADALGQFTNYPTITALRRFITQWRMIFQSDDQAPSIRDSNQPCFIGIDGFEKSIYPRSLPDLVEKYEMVSERVQFLITSHSPVLLNSMRAEEVRILDRDEHGFARVVRASDVRGVKEFVAAGASLGDLWMEGHLDENWVGDEK